MIYSLIAYCVLPLQKQIAMNHFRQYINDFLFHNKILFDYNFDFQWICQMCTARTMFC